MSESAEAWCGGPLRGKGREPRVQFGQVWEDVSLERSLARGRCLCIASGGETAWELLLSDCASVTAVDVNVAQVHLVALKRAAFQLLNLAELRQCMTVDARPYLPRLAEFYRPSELWPDRGLMASGRVDRILALLFRLDRIFVHGPRFVGRTLCLDDTSAQRKAFDSGWNNWRWRAAVRFALSPLCLRLTLGRFFSNAAPKQVASQVLADFEEVLTAYPLNSNRFAWEALLGELPPAIWPEWLTEQGLERLRWRLPHMQVLHADVSDAFTDGPFDCVFLSNVHDGASPEDRRRLMTALDQGVAPNGLFLTRSLFRQGSGLVELSQRRWQRIEMPNRIDRSLFCRNAEVWEAVQ